MVSDSSFFIVNVDCVNKKGETLDFIVDEGNSVYQDVVPGVDIPVAMIGVTEKGSQ